MHLSEGEIRTYLDQELNSFQHENVEDHLATCATCQEMLETLRVRSQQVREDLSVLEYNSGEQSFSADKARARLSVRISNSKQKEGNMWDNIKSLLPRPAWISLAVIALLVVSLAFAPVRAIANTFLGLFRVEQVRVVEFSAQDLPGELGSSSQFEYIMSNDVDIQERGELQEVTSPEEASALAGFPVRLPAQIEGQETLEVLPGGDVTFNVNLEQIRTVLSDIGRADIELPDSLDGATVFVDIQAGVQAKYGECEFDLEEDLENHQTPRRLDCTTFLQIPSPTVSAPPGLDIVQIGEAFLQVTGMSPEEAADFARSVDWTTTLIIPVPRYGSEHEEVQVDGVTGTLIQEYGYKMDDRYLLIWVKDGILHALSGPGDSTAALEIASSLK
ncbi:anti-sigma factor family protein [Chloroflexota bacterium]